MEKDQVIISKLNKGHGGVVVEQFFIKGDGNKDWGNNDAVRYNGMI